MKIKITDVETKKSIEVDEAMKNGLVDEDLIFNNGTEWQTDSIIDVEVFVEVNTKHFYIDVPPINGSDEWHNVATFDTREEALKYAKEKFGADSEGRICILSVS